VHVRSVGVIHGTTTITVRSLLVAPLTPAHRKNRQGQTLHNVQAVNGTRCISIQASQCVVASGRGASGAAGGGGITWLRNRAK
jgi:hypothetical protein